MSTKCKNVTDAAVYLDDHPKVCVIAIIDVENILAETDAAENPVTAEKLSKSPKIEEYMETVWILGRSCVEISRQRYTMMSEVPENGV